MEKIMMLFVKKVCKKICKAKGADDSFLEKHWEEIWTVAKYCDEATLEEFIEKLMKRG